MEEYYSYTKEALQIKSKVPIKFFDSSEETFIALAEEMKNIIVKNNANNKATVIICTVGPVKQYPFFIEMINTEKISLKNCWFINMDAYLSDDGNYIDINNKLSFRGYMERQVYAKILPELLMPQEQRIFPDPHAPETVTNLLNKFGGADLCIAGIGMNGHLAFNEPMPELSAEEFAKIRTRRIRISEVSRACCASADLSGALEAVPHWAISLGISELFDAKAMRIGVFRDWHRGVLRRTACGSVSANFPATLLQNHKNVCIYANDEAAKPAI